MIAGRYAGDAGADFAHDARAFMAEHAGEKAFGIESVERVGIGVADAGGHDLDQHLACLGPFQVELDDFERLLRGEGDCSAGFHG